MKLSQAAQVSHGTLNGEDLEFTRVSTDTRGLAAGDFFVALRGDNFDAHDFLQVAAQQGASAAMVEKPTEHFASYVQVDNSRRGLGQLAAGWADQFSALRIAVTGNAGKTTVKEMIACMLGDDVLATSGNLNNEIGVPLTLLELRQQHRFAVLELGASAAGEIAWTTSLVRPQVAMITNVTGAHLEGFGSLQGIANAKAEIFSGMPAGAIAIINEDDRFAGFFAEQAADHSLTVIRIGHIKGLDFSATAVECESKQTRFQLVHQSGQYDVTIPLPSAHQVSNALMAFAAAMAAGIDLPSAISRLASIQPVQGRMNISECLGGTLVDDSYNANPGSVRAAIDWLSHQDGPVALVIGGLAELGNAAAQIQHELGEYAQQASLDTVIAMSEAAAMAKGYGEAAHIVADAMAAADKAKAILGAGGTVLVKGSRSARMEAVIEVLRAMGETH